MTQLTTRRTVRTNGGCLGASLLVRCKQQWRQSFLQLKNTDCPPPAPPAFRIMLTTVRRNSYVMMSHTPARTRTHTRTHTHTHAYHVVRTYARLWLKASLTCTTLAAQVLVPNLRPTNGVSPGSPLAPPTNAINAPTSSALPTSTEPARAAYPKVSIGLT